MIKGIVFILTAVLLAACGGTAANLNTPGGGTTKVSKVGFVALSQITVQGITTRSGTSSFFGYAQAIDIPNNSNFLPSDTCGVSDGTGGGDGGTDTNPPTSLDAGAALTLKTGTDTYATLAKQTQGTQIFYSSSPTTPLLPFPSSVTLDIPGAEGGFPAFSNVAFPAIPAEFSFSASSAFNAVSKNTTFSWTGAGPNDSSILFTGSGPGANNKTIFFTCFANDDGNFAFPSTTQSELDAFGFTTGTVPAASRVVFATQKQGDVGLLVSVFRTESLAVAP